MGSLALFFYTAFRDPGKVPPRIKSASAVEEFMLALNVAALGEPPVDASGHKLDFKRLCTTTWVLKGLRTKYCTTTGACIEEFDHFCVWLNASIGRGNHRAFIALALVELMTQMCHIYLCIAMGLRLVAYNNFWRWVFTMMQTQPTLYLMMGLQCIT